MLRTQMESGESRQRRTSASVPEKVTLKWKLTAQEMEVWRSWWKYTLLDGTAWFQCQITSGASVVESNCRFTDVYSAMPEGPDVWIVSGQLETDDLPLMSEADLEAYLNG
jgi:hypothetical protein